MHIIAVASGKGGVGKSTTSVNLAYTLKDMGYKVGLLDADIYGPSLPLLVHKTEPISHDVQQTKDGKIIPPTYGGVKVLSVGHFQEQIKAAVMRGPMVNSLIKQLFSSVDWSGLDYLIIDYPPGTGDIQITLSQIANITAALIVTTPQEISLSDVRKAIHMFKMTNVKIAGVVENMSSFICDSCDKEHKIFLENGGEKIAEEFQLPLLAHFPLEKSLALASDEGKPLVLTQAESMVNLKFKELAQTLDMICQNEEGATLDKFSLSWQKA